jgi:hypothetical protein
MRFVLILVGCMFSCQALSAQDSLSAGRSAKFNIADLSFISGKWTGTMEWGDMEENWSTPMGNCMMCVYRCVKNGKVVFYEFIVIEQNEDSIPVMKLRHFSPGSVGWEDKNNPYEYPLVSIESNKARFERPDKQTSMVYQRVSKNKLRVTLERQENGKWKIDVFNYTLAEK